MGDLGCREGKKEGRNVVRGLVRGGWDLLVISLFNVEKARDEARELPTVRRYQFYDGVRLGPFLPPNFFKSSILISSSCSLS